MKTLNLILFSVVLTAALSHTASADCRVQLSPEFNGLMRLQATQILKERDCEVVDENFQYTLKLYHHCVLSKRPENARERWMYARFQIFMDSVTLIDIQSGKKISKPNTTQGLVGPAQIRLHRKDIRAIHEILDQAGL